MLIFFSGLLGTGKTTIVSDLATRTRAVYLRIDTIEPAIRDSGALSQDVGRSGYMIANELALSNLRFGSTVIVDCVNQVIESRHASRQTDKVCGTTAPLPANTHEFARKCIWSDAPWCHRCGSRNCEQPHQPTT
ncbi:hypothetical protein Pgy4_22911, partial [Pseudomonas savastanoi pv. glycinea str. race 4]